LVLAIREVEKEYTSNNMSKYLFNIIKDYRIEKNLGYIVIDNALNNNTIMIALSQALCYKYRLNYNLIYYCICC